MAVIQTDGTILRGEAALTLNPYATFENWLDLRGKRKEFDETPDDDRPMDLLSEFFDEDDAARRAAGSLFAGGGEAEGTEGRA